jgi:PAS domain S-box-containing protein
MTGEGRDERVRALEAEVRRLLVMLECAPDYIMSLSPDLKFLYLNRLAPGFSMEQVLGSSVVEYLPPESRDVTLTALKAARDTCRVQQFANVARVSADRFGHYLTGVSPVIEDGQVTSLVMISTDISAIESQRILLQVALDATGLGIWTNNLESGTETWDDTTRRIVGVSASRESERHTLADHVHPEDAELVRQGLSHAHSTGRYGPLEHRIVRPGGEVRWVAVSGQIAKDAVGKPVSLVGSVQDITDRRSLEARLVEAQKLESIGRLAGGVAHDFNNMLTAILGNLDFASDAASVDEMRPLLDEIRLAAERSTALTAQLLAFARRQVISPTVINPNTLIQRLDALLRRLLGEQIQVTLSFAAVGRVRVDESQLEQVIMNLVTNARDAMPEGGHLRVETADVVLNGRFAARTPDVIQGLYVALSVTDTGPGIPHEALPHLFEPFYTARPGGTGLGLPVCYGIVKQNRGHIEVESEPGCGTKFTVYLPRVDTDVASAQEPRAGTVAKATERVLLVEDEPAVRAVAERALTRQGYRVRSLGSAEEALRQAGSDGFDLLVTDVVLPGQNGRELARQLTQKWPSLRVLFISGYTQNTIERDGVLEPGISFLQKPFLPVDLVAAARKVLEGTGSGKLI